MEGKKSPEKINERTGISEDYWNEYCRIGHFLYEHTEKVCPLLKGGSKIKSYEERFPKGEYEDVVNDKNRKRVEMLDRIAKEINSMADDKKCNVGKAKTLVKRAFCLIHGEKEKCWDEANSKDYASAERKEEIKHYLKEKEEKENKEKEAKKAA